MSALSEDAPVQVTEIIMLTLWILGKYLFTSAAIAVSIAGINPRTLPEIQEMDIAILNSGFTWQSTPRNERRVDLREMSWRTGGCVCDWENSIRFYFRVCLKEVPGLILSSLRETCALTRRNTSSEVMKSRARAFRAPLGTRDSWKMQGKR